MSQPYQSCAFTTYATRACGASIPQFAEHVSLTGVAARRRLAHCRTPLAAGWYLCQGSNLVTWRMKPVLYRMSYTGRCGAGVLTRISLVYPDPIRGQRLCQADQT